MVVRSNRFQQFTMAAFSFRPDWGSNFPSQNLKSEPQVFWLRTSNLKTGCVCQRLPTIGYSTFGAPHISDPGWMRSSELKNFWFDPGRCIIGRPKFAIFKCDLSVYKFSASILSSPAGAKIKNNDQSKEEWRMLKTTSSLQLSLEGKRADFALD